jgi:hypothetical protein
MDEGRTGWRSEFRVRNANVESRVYSILAWFIGNGDGAMVVMVWRAGRHRAGNN